MAENTWSRVAVDTAQSVSSSGPAAAGQQCSKHGLTSKHCMSSAQVILLQSRKLQAQHCCMFTMQPKGPLKTSAKAQVEKHSDAQ
jgi:hypothetical protein